MGKKQQIKHQKTLNQQPIQPVQVQEEESKSDLALRATNKATHKYLPYQKYVIKKTKLINKRKHEAIEFIKLDKFQVAKAVQCLKQFDESHQNVKNLFSEDGFIYLEIDASRVPENYSIRPVQVTLPCPIYSQQYNSRFTIFSCDPEKEFTDKLQSLEVPLIAEVIGYERVKKHFRESKDKLKLLAANDLFFCDWKLYNLLRQPLGKLFYQRKKFPFPIDCQQIPEDVQSKFDTYQEYINNLGNHTYFMMGNGPVQQILVYKFSTIKIGRVSMSAPDLVKNVMRGVFRALPHILGSELKSKDIRQISLKTFNSPSLPIYNFLNQEQLASYRTVEKQLEQQKKKSKKGKVHKMK